MDNNGSEKKTRRPRIGQSQATPNADGQSFNRYEKVNYGKPAADGDNADGERHYRRSYDNRQSGGYNNRGGYNSYNNRQGGYGNNRRSNYRDYNNDYNTTADGNTDTTAAQGDSTEQTRTQDYRHRYNSYGNNRQGGYNNNNRGGYNNNRQGGYNNRQGGYSNNSRGGYNNNRQGGYNNNRGGYNNNNRQVGYNNNRGGYNNNRQGGYNNRAGQNRNNGDFTARGKSFTPRPKRVEYEMPIPDPNEQIRLNKFMSNAGICSRREADEFIQQGLVKVNGQVVTELGTKITHSDIVEYDEKVVALESKCYILLNKPKDCVTTSDDPNGRLTVMDLVKGACSERIYPVGRLDRNTTGVLLLTNDGDLASKLTHPKYVKKKIYHVWCDKDISEDDMQRIADGIELDDGPIHADAISYATETDRNQAGIEIHSGRNRIVRRIFESLGYHVTKLDRVYFAGLTKKNLPRGRWRYLTQEEVNFLKMGSFE